MRQKGTPALKFFYRYMYWSEIHAKLYTMNRTSKCCSDLFHWDNAGSTRRCDAFTADFETFTFTGEQLHACSGSNNRSPATLPSMLINGRVALRPLSLYIIHVHVARNTGKGHGNWQCLGREVSG